MNAQERADIELLLDALSRGWMTFEQSQDYNRMRAALGKDDPVTSNLDMIMVDRLRMWAEYLAAYGMVTDAVATPSYTLSIAAGIEAAISVSGPSSTTVDSSEARTPPAPLHHPPR